MFASHHVFPASFEYKNNRLAASLQPVVRLSRCVKSLPSQHISGGVKGQKTNSGVRCSWIFPLNSATTNQQEDLNTGLSQMKRPFL